jgi:hypothetical protein
LDSGRSRLAALTLGMLVGGGALVATRSDPAIDAAAAAERAGIDTPPSTAPPTGDEVVQALKVESGMSTTAALGCDVVTDDRLGLIDYSTDCAPGTASPIGERVSYGVVVENTGDQLLQNIPITLQFLDAQGQVVKARPVAFGSSDLAREKAQIDFLRPGERFGFGGTRLDERSGATRIQLTVGPPSDWMPIEEAGLTYGEALSAPRPTAEVTGFASDADAGTTVSYELTGIEGHRSELRMVYVVLRDDQGRIVGGVEAPVEQLVTSGAAARGEWEQSAEVAAPGVDLAKSEAYVTDNPVAVL